jgi:hypothetical protein
LGKNNRGRDNRSRERAASGLIDTGDGSCAALKQCALKLESIDPRRVVPSCHAAKTEPGG